MNKMTNKIKYNLEFVVKSSPSLLFNYISSPSGLEQWFSDNVKSRGEQFIFIWENSEDHATLISKKNNHSVKFKWDEEDDDTFFELRIQIDDLTQDVALIVTDFADEDELEEAKLLWETQLSNLHAIIG
jgi:uncharacterized protein YndB with AHSA1/START domain